MRAWAVHPIQWAILAFCLVGSMALAAEHQEGSWEEGVRRAHELQSAGRYGEAVEMLEGLVLQAAGSGIKDQRLGIVLHNLGTAHYSMGRYLDARRNLERALQILREDGHVGDLNVINTMNSLSTVYAELREYSRAERLTREVTTMLAARPDAPRAAATRADLNLAKLLIDRGRTREAEEILLAAIQRAKDTASSDSAEAILLVNLYGNLLTTTKRWKEAATLFEEVRSSCRRRWGDDHPITAKSMINLAAARRHMGQLEEAETLARDAAARLGTKVGPDHIAVGAALVEQAAALRGLGRTKEAKQLAKRAAAILERGAKDNQIGALVDAAVLTYTERR